MTDELGKRLASLIDKTIAAKRRGRLGQRDAAALDMEAEALAWELAEAAEVLEQSWRATKH